MSSGISQDSEIDHQGVLDVPFFTANNCLGVLLVFSIFLTTFYLRDDVSSTYAYLNIPFYILIALIAAHNGCRFDMPSVLMWCILTALFFVAEVRAGTSSVDIIQFFSLYCLPLLICSLEITADNQTRRHLAASCIRAVNVATLIIFCILLVDLVTGSAVMRLIADHFMPDVRPWVDSAIMSRHPSIWGHYLLTGGFYLAFYYLNVYYDKVFHSWLMDSRLVYVVASIGILSTGGKTVMVLYLVSVYWLTITGEHRIRNAALLMFFFLVLYLFGAFDVVFNRFNVADLSSGRNEAIQALFSVGPPHIFTGYGEAFIADMSMYVSPNTVSVASEYSFVALAYKYGIIFVLLMVAILLRRPFITSYKMHDWTLFFMVTVLVIYFTTFNAFAVNPDAYGLAVLLIFITMLCKGEGDYTNNVSTRIHRHSDIQTLRDAKAGNK